MSDSVKKLDDLLSKIKSYTFVNAELIVLDEMDDILDERDNKEFENDFINISKEIEESLGKYNISDTEQKKLNSIGKVSFVRAFQLSDSDEVAESISDDLVLIAKGILLEKESPWLDELLKCYEKNEFPRGSLIK